MYHLLTVNVQFLREDRYFNFIKSTPKTFLQPKSIPHLGTIIITYKYYICITYASYVYIYIYAIMKAMCPPGYHHNDLVATHALGHMMYGYTLGYSPCFCGI